MAKVRRFQPKKGFKTKAKGRHTPGVMNKTEAAYASELEAMKYAGEILWYKFEAIKLRLAKKTTLTVDFFVMRADGALEVHEVKGSKNIYWDDAKVKMKVAAEMYPFPFFLIYPKPKRDGGGWVIEEVL